MKTPLGANALHGASPFSASPIKFFAHGHRFLGADFSAAVVRGPAAPRDPWRSQARREHPPTDAPRRPAFRLFSFLFVHLQLQSITQKK